MHSMQPNVSQTHKCKKKCIKVNTGNSLSGKCIVYDILYCSYIYIILFSLFHRGSVLIKALF